MNTSIKKSDSEIWKQIPELKAMASSEGRIKSFYRYPEGKIRKPQKGRGEYKRIQLQLRGKYYSVHQLVAMAWHENINGYTIVNHLDGDPSNNKPENLEWCDQKHNVNHANTKIEKWNFRRFTLLQKTVMVEAYKRGFSKNSIANYFKVTDTTIRRIVLR